MRGGFTRGGVVILATSCSTAQASAEPAWLTWKAPEECPSSADIEKKVVDLLGKGLDPVEMLHVEGGVGWSQSGWSVELDIQYGSASGHRAVVAKTCGEAADFVALSIGLAVHPELLSQASSDEEVVPERAPVERPEGKPEEAPPPTPEPSAGAVAPAEKPSPLRFGVGASALVSWLALPNPRIGPRVEFALDAGPWHLFVGGAWLPSTGTTFADAARPVAFDLLWADAGTCYRWANGRFSWGPCLGFQVGALGSQESEGAAQRNLWAAAAVGGDGSLKVTPWLDLNLRANAVIPIVRPEFVLSGGTVVHQLPGVDVQTQLGFALSF